MGNWRPKYFSHHSCSRTIVWTLEWPPRIQGLDILELEREGEHNCIRESHSKKENLCKQQEIMMKLPASSGLSRNVVALGDSAHNSLTLLLCDRKCPSFLNESHSTFMKQYLHRHHFNHGPLCSLSHSFLTLAASFYHSDVSQKSSERKLGSLIPTF